MYAPCFFDSIIAGNGIKYSKIGDDFIKTQEQVIQALAKTAQDKLLLRQLFERISVSQERAYLTHTRFLDLRERTLCTQAVQQAGFSRQTVFWGGYADAERVMALCLPDYLSPEDVTAGEQSPLVLLRAVKNQTDTLNHRDYLGALMGLGIERDVLGDIVLTATGADIFVLEDMADFIEMNFLRAGRKRVTLERANLCDFELPEMQQEQGEGSVASLRLDSVCALIFRLSRSQIQERIAKGTVFLNQMQCLKPDAEVALGDKMTVRGLGRAQILELGGMSRKGRQFVRYTRSQ